jgi:hypothetical protein
MTSYKKAALFDSAGKAWTGVTRRREAGREGGRRMRGDEQRQRQREAESREKVKQNRPAFYR